MKKKKFLSLETSNLENKIDTRRKKKIKYYNSL